jgi:two-component system, NtrC family, sensor histidine kinase HydH
MASRLKTDAAPRGDLTADAPPAIRRRQWVFAVVAFVLGVLIAAVAMGAGVRIMIAGRDFSVLAALVLEAALASAGFSIGRMVEARTAERRQQVAAKRTLEEMAGLQARLAELQRIATIGQLGASVAHEIRNPLAIIRSMVQNLSDTAAGRPEDVEPTCKAVLEEIDRVSQVTTMLLGLSRPAVARIVAVDPQLVLSRVEWLARQLPVGRAVSFHVRSVGPQQLMRGDPDLLCQVMLELCANAAAVTPPGGHIWLESRSSGGEVVLTVCDQGPGIPGEVRDRIFDPFFSLKAGGSGIGLAVARQIVGSQGGAIDAHTGAHGGARLEIRMPAVDAV